MTITSAVYVLVITLQVAGDTSTLNLYTFTGINALGDCVANGQRITAREGEKIGGASKVKAHCERIDVPPQTSSNQ